MDSYYDGPLSEYAQGQGYTRGPKPTDSIRDVDMPRDTPAPELRRVILTVRTPAEKLAEVIALHRPSLVVQCGCKGWRPSSLTLTLRQFNTEHERHLTDAILAHLEAEGWAEGATGREPIRTYYSSYTPDGKLWCQSRDPDEVRERSEGKGCTFERFDVYEQGVCTDWELITQHEEQETDEP